MNIFKKALRRVIIFLVERYFPDRIFYGDAANPFGTVEKAANTLNRSLQMICAQALISECYESNGERLEVTLDGVTRHNEEIGEWKVTIEKIK